jgi:hypothetical protein
LALIFLLEQVLNGLLVGAYYLLIALGLSLIFSLGGIVNLRMAGFTPSVPISRSRSRPLSASAARSLHLPYSSGF